MCDRKASCLLIALLASGTACTVGSSPSPGPKGDQGSPGPTGVGPKGDKGDPGKDGVVDASVLTALQAEIDALQAKVDALENQAADPNCPPGHTETSDPAIAFLPNAIVCNRGQDEVVKVATGGAAFWIDRYEASVWTTAEGPSNGLPKFAQVDDSSATFPKNGQVSVPLFALSVVDAVPGSKITWFQAAEACAASGKRLPTGEEWLRAARHTFDPDANDGTIINNAKCNTMAPSQRMSGKALGMTQDTSCVSDWGAEDMVGNLWEWTAEWYAGLGDVVQSSTKTNWPDTSYGGDGTWNIASSAYNGTAVVPYVPAAGFRGGVFDNGPLAGVFALDLGYAPSASLTGRGFRCVRSR